MRVSFDLEIGEGGCVCVLLSFMRENEKDVQKASFALIWCHSLVLAFAFDLIIIKLSTRFAFFSFFF